jgi:protoporphyrinogen oxidase
LKLRYRNTILVYLEIDHESLFPDQWLYVHSTDITMGRISNFRNWHTSLNGDRKSTILCLEYWCNFEDDLWKKPDPEIIAIAKKEMEVSGLAGKTPVKKGFVYKIPRSYPVYFKGYKQILKPVEEYLTGIENLYVIGRYGTYKYNNQDHSVLMGLLAAENILENKGHNLWNINTDYEDYQESSVITKTGLSPAD